MPDHAADEPGTINTGHGARRRTLFTVDPVARRISLGGGLVDGSADIAADGTFAIDSGADRWGFKRARGRVAAGGFVIVDHAETMECHTNYAGDRVHGATRMVAAIGAAEPNYR